MTDSICNSGSPTRSKVQADRRSTRWSGAGSAIFGALADFVIVIVLTVYFVVDMPRIRTALYRLVPHTRRPRAILIGDEVFRQGRCVRPW